MIAGIDQRVAQTRGVVSRNTSQRAWRPLGSYHYLNVSAITVYPLPVWVNHLRIDFSTLVNTSAAVAYMALFDQTGTQRTGASDYGYSMLWYNGTLTGNVANGTFSSLAFDGEGHVTNWFATHRIFMSGLRNTAQVWSVPSQGAYVSTSTAGALTIAHTWRTFAGIVTGLTLYANAGAFTEVSMILEGSR